MSFRLIKPEPTQTIGHDPPPALDVHFENLADGQIRRCSAVDLQNALNAGLVWFKSDFEFNHKYSGGELPAVISEALNNVPLSLRSFAIDRDFSEKHVWIARLRRSGISQLRPSTLNPIALLIKDLEIEYRGTSFENCRFSPWTLYKADLAIKKSGAEAILPKYFLRGGRGGKRLDPTVESIVGEELQKLKADDKKPIVAAHIEQKINGRIALLNEAGNTLRPISAPTVRARINAVFDAYEILVRRLGKDRANRVYRESYARSSTLNALDVVQYDDKDTAVFLCDDKLRLPWGRCYLTAGVDEGTLMPVGTSMSIRERDSTSAFSAVLDGIYPKDPREARFQLCKRTWRAYGQHGLVILDNATYNASNATLASLLELDIEIEFARPHRPEDKAEIEHFFHVFVQDHLMHEPGWVGPKEDRELINRGLSTAVMDKTQFIQRATAWMVDIYPFLQRDGKNPLAAHSRWELEYGTVEPSLPLRRPVTDLVKGIRDELKFRASGGLQRLLLRYNNGDAERLRKKFGHNASMPILYLQDRLDYLYLGDPESMNWYRIPCIEDDRFYAGLTDYQQRLLIKTWRWMKKKGTPALIELAGARERLMHYTEQLRFSPKVTERRRAQLLKEAYSAEKSAQQAPQPVKPRSQPDKLIIISDLERMVQDLDAMELGHVL